MATTLTDLPKVKSIDHSLEPLWASDAGRNSISGKYSGTFIGYFDKLKVSIGRCTKAQMQTLRGAIDVPIIEDLTFPDSYTGSTKTEDFYGTAISAKLNHINGMYEECSFNLIAIAKRTDV